MVKHFVNKNLLQEQKRKFIIVLSEIPVLPLLITAVTGGLAGAIINSLINKRLQRIRLSLDFISERGNQFEIESKVIGYLSDPVSYDWKGAYDWKVAEDSNEIIDRKDRYNLILKIGNWYNTLAYLYLENHLNRKLIESSDLDEDMIQFSNDINGKLYFENWGRLWPCLFKFKLEYSMGRFRPKAKCK